MHVSRIRSRRFATMGLPLLFPLQMTDRHARKPAVRVVHMIIECHEIDKVAE